ncbi:MAG: c-type cytochrome, partial [Planctomycetaceae bacterium]|nr:c-type cytochrome [Planctomycetaceae bacterium]
ALRGNYGDGPWNRVFENTGSESRVPNGMFEVPPGFVVDKLFTVPKDELGSWVCIAFDNKGRLLASDQGDKGICRITLPALGSDSETVVERLDFSKCESSPTGAQGMLWAFDSLYFSINGGPGSGLYRARDKDGDDQFDECVKLKDFRGGGEHGPHSLRLSPDGQRIFVIAGNHTQPPFSAGEELNNSDLRSRIPTNWDEDLLLPRMWDANGHARGVLAPGGWIASTDPDGKSWDIWSIGYRNPYDMAFNADGELFAYDADMEWDVGAPWYRPTRVVHATPGSEFGWRSGTGKWPVYYADSLPPLVNIGPGSPVGVDFGYGLRFPAKYQKALFICDWTFGTMYAIHMEPSKSTYKAVKEEFVARTPLPLTDVAAGPDGALYFTIGGRGTQSELFRVTYSGPESTEPVDYRNQKFAAERAHRRDLEKWLGWGAAREALLPPESNQFLTSAKADIASGDRFLRTASRNAFFNSQVLWENLDAADMSQAELSQSTPDELIAVAIAFARAPVAQVIAKRNQSADEAERWKQTTQESLIRFLSALDFQTLSTEQKLDYTRALSLIFLRLAPPTETQQASLLKQLDRHFPSSSEDVNRELCQVLVYLNSPTIVDKTVALMQKPSVPTVTEDLQALLARNRGYGSAINNMIANAPDQQQIWYAYCLRTAKAGWTPDNRKGYFSWFERAATWSGGNSFRKFLQNIDDETFLAATENERVMIEASGARKPYQAPELPKPSGPGKDWTLEEVRALAADKLKGRNFDNGQKMFAATRCILCHRFAGDGGATGPDLTQLAGRFNVEALTEAMLDPSKVISDQYRGSSILTVDGKTITGRVVSENDEQVSVLTDPEDSTKIVDIRKKDIDELIPSTVSLMPVGLLKPLNEDEVLDLLAYLLSRGDKGHPMFRR